MSSLGELFDTYNKILEQVVENEGELTPEIEKELQTTEQNLSKKVDNYVEFLNRTHSEIEYWKNKKQEMDEIKKALEALKKRLENNAFYYIKKNGVNDLIGNMYKFKLQKSTPRLIIDDVNKLPWNYKSEIVDIEIDKDKLKRDLQNGYEIEGAHLEGGLYLKKSYNKGTK